MTFFLRFIGVMNAAVWVGGAVFYSFGIAPAFFAPEMRQLFGEAYTGVVSMAFWDKYYTLFYWCGVIALVHQLAEWVYLGKALQRFTIGILAAIFGYALVAGLWLQPKLKDLHKVSYAREGVYPVEVQARAARSYLVWKRVSQGANLLVLTGLLTYAWRINTPPTGPRFVSTGKFRS